MKLLVTGSNGQLGHEIQKLAKQAPYADHTFYFTDVKELDICDEEALHQFFMTHEVDVIINCAAYTAVDKAETEPELCERINRIAPQNLAQVAQANGARVIQISTDYVFDGTNHRPYTEDDPTSPCSVYGRTKLAGEEAVLNFCPLSTIIRTAWLYSIHGTNFVKTMIRLGKTHQALNVVVDQIGTPTYAGDLALAAMKMAVGTVQPGIYHYTDEGVCSWYDFTLAIHEMAHITDCVVTPIPGSQYPTPAARPHYSVLDKQKIRSVNGITTPYWRDSLRKCIAELNEQETNK